VAPPDKASPAQHPPPKFQVAPPPVSEWLSARLPEPSRKNFHQKVPLSRASARARPEPHPPPTYASTSPKQESEHDYTSEP